MISGMRAIPSLRPDLPIHLHPSPSDPVEELLPSDLLSRGQTEAQRVGQPTLTGRMWMPHYYANE